MSSVLDQLCDGCGKTISPWVGMTSWREGSWVDGEFHPGPHRYRTHGDPACQRLAVTKPEQLTLQEQA